LERACALAPDDELAAFLLDELRSQGRRALGKLSLGRKRAARVIEERRRTTDARGADEHSPSKPTRPQFGPANPFAPLGEASASESQRVLAGPADASSPPRGDATASSPGAAEPPRGSVPLSGTAFAVRSDPNPSEPPRGSLPLSGMSFTPRGDAGAADPSRGLAPLARAALAELEPSDVPRVPIALSRPSPAPSRPSPAIET